MITEAAQALLSCVLLLLELPCRVLPVPETSANLISVVCAEGEANSEQADAQTSETTASESEVAPSAPAETAQDSNAARASSSCSSEAADSAEAMSAEAAPERVANDEASMGGVVQQLQKLALQPEGEILGALSCCTLV